MGNTLKLNKLGFFLEYMQRNRDSERFLLLGRAEEYDPAVALHFGGPRSGGVTGSGLLPSELDERVYINNLHFWTTSDQRRIYTLDFGYNESINNSAQLRLGAVEHQFGATLNCSSRKNSVY